MRLHQLHPGEVMIFLDFFKTVASYVQGGGFFTYCVLFVFASGLAISIERFLKLGYKYHVDGASFMNELQRHILTNDISTAINICSGTQALLPLVLKNGLKRASSDLDEIQGALDATALGVIPKATERLNRLPVLANISTLCGLLGTIQGLIHTFEALSMSDPEHKAKILSAGIAEAMNTTFLGLISAILILVMHSFLAEKSEKIINEIDEYSVKLLDLLRIRSKKIPNNEMRA
jgi:biopolymer transport protein ExbB